MGVTSTQYAQYNSSGLSRLCSVRGRCKIRLMLPDRFEWKRTSDYYDQAHAENAFSRYKQTFGGRLRAKRDAAQEREAALACGVLNRMRELGRPQSSPVS